MRPSHASICTIVLVLYSLFILPVATSADVIDDRVSCEFTVDMISGTQLSIEVTADVQRITLSASGNTYTKSDIQTFSTSNPETMGAIKYAIKTAISDQIRGSFPDSEIKTDNALPLFSSPYFSDSYHVSLSPTFFSLNETVNASELINGLLDCDAVINYSIPLKASFGWNNTFVFVLPETLSYKRTTGTVKQEKITWKVFNSDGNTPQRTAEVSLMSTDPSYKMDGNQSIKTTFEIQCQNPKTPQLAVVLNAESVDITPYNPLPPSFSNIITLPSDGVRLLAKNNLITWDDLYTRTLQPFSGHIIDTVEQSSFNQTLDIVFSYDINTTESYDEPFDVSNMDSSPPIRGLFIDENIDLQIFDISSRAVFGCINAGANVSITSLDVNFGEGLDQLNSPFDCLWRLPEHIYLEGSRSFRWDKTTPLAGAFSSDNAPLYTEQNISTDIVIEIESTDMNLLSFFTGRTELTIGVFLSETQQRHATRIPEPLELPLGIVLPFMNADAFRLCIEEGVFDEDDVESFLLEQTNRFENHAKTLFASLQGKALVDKTSFERSLLWDEDISHMNATDPIEIVSTFHSSYPLLFSFSLVPPGFQISTQNITFTGITDQSVTYTIIFPKGTTIDVNDTLGRANVIETPEGKISLVVSFDASEGDLVNTVSVCMRPSGLFIIGLFVPCIISIIITIILLIVIYVIRKKRNRLRGTSTPADRGYEEEDYYVPPPPSKKR